MPGPSAYVLARVLIASVFIGLGAARMASAIGLFGDDGAVFGLGALAFSGFELAVGVMLALGWQVRWLASLMAVVLAIDAALSHPFWSVAPAELHGQLLHFLKNLAAIGGLILLAWIESGGRLSRGSL